MRDGSSTGTASMLIRSTWQARKYPSSTQHHGLQLTRNIREYQPFVKNLMSILDSKPIVYHVGLKPHPATRCLSGAPITEIVNFYVDPSMDSETGASNIEKFSKVMTELDINTDPSHFTGSAYGLTLDEHSDATAKASGKTKSWVILAGWGSIDDHNKSSGSQEVKDAMPLLMELPGLKDITAVHVKLQVIEGGSIGAAGGLGAGERGALPGNAQEEVLNPHDQSSGGVKTRSDGSTTKTQDGIPQHKERAGRGGETGYHHSGGPKGN
jgi:hypothetical protein